MIIDLKKIQSLEKKYQNDGITLSALNNMVHIVSQSDEEVLKGTLALSTLLDLGVVTGSTDKEPEQLNS